MQDTGIGHHFPAGRRRCQRQQLPDAVPVGYYRLLGYPTPQCRRSTALGAAYLAGLAVGFWSGLDELRQNVQIDRTFEPAMDDETRSRLLHGWEKAVSRTLAWED